MRAHKRMPTSIKRAGLINNSELCKTRNHNLVVHKGNNFIIATLPNISRWIRFIHMQIDREFIEGGKLAIIDKRADKPITPRITLYAQPHIDCRITEHERCGGRLPVHSIAMIDRSPFRCKVTPRRKANYSVGGPVAHAQFRRMLMYIRYSSRDIIKGARHQMLHTHAIGEHECVITCGIQLSSNRKALERIAYALVATAGSNKYPGSPYGAVTSRSTGWKMKQSHVSARWVFSNPRLIPNTEVKIDTSTHYFSHALQPASDAFDSIHTSTRGGACSNGDGTHTLPRSRTTHHQVATKTGKLGQRLNFIERHLRSNGITIIHNSKTPFVI